MKRTSWIFCSFLLVSTNLAYAADKEAVNTVNNTKAAVNAEAAAIEKGKALHEKHCMACHIRMNKEAPNEIYTRDNHKVKSWNSLQTQVHRCNSQLDLSFFDDEIKGLVDYLNQEFYKFEKKSN
jgi:hypothetical protein